MDSSLLKISQLARLAAIRSVLWIAVSRSASDGATLSLEALSHYLLQSCTAPCELSLYGAVEKVCGFFYVQAIKVPKLKRFTQGRRELRYRVGESFLKFPPAGHLFGVQLVVWIRLRKGTRP
jgi:hypothetical protein